MPRNPLTLLACALASAVLVLPGCGGDDGEARTDPAAQPAPRQQVQGVERRVGELEAEIEKLRRDLEGVRNEQSATDGAGDETAAEERDASEPSSGAGEAGSPAQGTGAAPGGSTRAGAAPGGGSSGTSPDGGSAPGGTDAGGGPDPGSPEDDPTIEDICGPNPAPNC